MVHTKTEKEEKLEILYKIVQKRIYKRLQQFPWSACFKKALD